MPVMVIGQNLPFDISAITGDGKWGYSQGEMYGGFTFNLHGDKTEDVEYPRLRIKKIGFAKHMFKFSPAGWVEYKQNGYHFIDIPQLARAVFGAGTPASMKALCRMFTIPLDKEEVDYGSKLYIEFVDYVCNDVERTWRCYRKLRAIYEQHERSRMIDKIYSEASLGKSYLDDTGVVPFTEGNIDKAIDAAHKSKMLQLCGVSMEAMYGARAEGHCRHEITECMVADFKSQYPTICTLLGLVDLMVAERIDVVVNDPKDEAFLRNTTIEDILWPDQACRETVWRNMLIYARILPNMDILPGRFIFTDTDDDTLSDDGEDKRHSQAAINIGVNYIHSGPETWYSAMDVLASKFPRENALRF